MEYLEAMHWLSIMDLAKKGMEEAKEDLEITNKRRLEKGLPTIEDEIYSLVEQGRKIIAEKERLKDSANP